MDYSQQLASPQWQKKRLEIFERDKFTCQICLDTETQLHVHHTYYDKSFKTMAWEYHDDCYKTLCSDCHRELTIHKKQHCTETEFDLMKVKKSDGSNFIFVYSKGVLRFDISNYDGTLTFTENTTYKIVQFLINNWLKNGK